MSKRKHGLPRQPQDIGDVSYNDVAHDDVEDDDDASSPKPAARTANGRFAPGHCPKPKGRPRKRVELIADLFAHVFDEKVPSSTAGSSKQITMGEFLICSVFVKGCKEPQVALALLKVFVSSCAAKVEERQAEHPEADSASLQRYVERETRRKALSERGEAADAGEDHDAAEDDEPEA